MAKGTFLKSANERNKRYVVPPLTFLLSYILLSQDPGQEAQLQPDTWDGVCLA